MSEPKTIGEILLDYFLSSQEPFAIAFRRHFASSNKQLSQEAIPFPVCTEIPDSSISDRLEDWLDNQDVMQILHISPRTLQTLRTNGILPFSRIGNKIYYRRSDISKILSDRYKMLKIKDYGGY